MPLGPLKNICRKDFILKDQSMKFHRMYIKERAQMKGQFMKIGFSLGTKKRKTEQTNGLK